MNLAWPDKDPDEVLDYYFNAAALIGETDGLDHVEWSVPGSFTVGQKYMTEGMAVIWLSSGAIAQHRIGVRVFTTEGRVYDRSIALNVRQR